MASWNATILNSTALTYTFTTGDLPMDGDYHVQAYMAMGDHILLYGRVVSLTVAPLGSVIPVGI
jgi:hypothetical protein